MMNPANKRKANVSVIFWGIHFRDRVWERRFYWLHSSGLLASVWSKNKDKVRQMFFCINANAIVVLEHEHDNIFFFVRKHVSTKQTNQRVSVCSCQKNVRMILLTSTLCKAQTFVLVGWETDGKKREGIHEPRLWGWNTPRTHAKSIKRNVRTLNNTHESSKNLRVLGST